MVRLIILPLVLAIALSAVVYYGHMLFDLSNLEIALIAGILFCISMVLYHHLVASAAIRRVHRNIEALNGFERELLRRIDNHLSSHDEWKIFETHFEQGHETFMKNLKNRYPDLTPGDMRLCAFLRMNLASKEIAPLMGISVRGVENHRYRLRSKLGLEHDENLIGTLLKL